MDTEIVPLSNGENGDNWNRNASGRFGAGNRGGPGSPVARHARELRERLDAALYGVVTPKRLAKAIDACLRQAEGGDIAALTLLANRLDPQKLHLKLETEPPPETVVLPVEDLVIIAEAHRQIAARRQQREQIAAKIS